MIDFKQIIFVLDAVLFPSSPYTDVYFFLPSFYWNHRIDIVAEDLLPLQSLLSYSLMSLVLSIGIHSVNEMIQFDFDLEIYWCRPKLA